MLTDIRVRTLPILVSLPLVSFCWTYLWTRSSFWSPLYFTGLWFGATLLSYSFGRKGHPGIRHHAVLSGLSVTLWWFFELVNLRVDNWHYVGMHPYSSWQYIAFSSLAYSTIIPALDSTWRLLRHNGIHHTESYESTRRYNTEVALGLTLLALVLAGPKFLFPLVWIAPFLTLDGLVGLAHGSSLIWHPGRIAWRDLIAIAMGGLICGFLWEFWNYWATPKWIYNIPILDFTYVFEMPILGYLGYVPFAGTIYQLLCLVTLVGPTNSKIVARF